MTEDEMKIQDGRWKSDFDLRLSKIETRLSTLESATVDLASCVKELSDVLNVGKGSVSMLYLCAKMAISLAAIAGAIYGFKAWILK